MDNFYYKLILGGFLVLIGLLFIIGTKRNVKFFVDPPEELWLFWTPSFFKKFVDPEGAKIISYIMGTIGMGLGLKVLWELIKRG